jgi:hypothetical protein
VSCGSYSGTEQERSFAHDLLFDTMSTTKKKAAEQPPSQEVHDLSYPLLAEMPQSVFTDEDASRPTGETAAITVRTVAVIGETIIAERGGGDRAGRSDRTADDTGREIARPETAIPVNLRTLLLMLNDFRSRMRTHRQCGRADRSC